MAYTYVFYIIVYICLGSSSITQLNGVKLGRGNTKSLRDGNEVAFGHCVEQANAEEDYRVYYIHSPYCSF